MTVSVTMIMTARAVIAAKRRRLGAHVSIAGGLDQAVVRVKAMGGSALQIFSSSPRMWLSAMPSKESIEVFKKACADSDVKPVFIHAKYLVNLASDKKSLEEVSVKSLIHDLNVANAIGAKGVVVHLGGHRGRGFAIVKDQLIKNINLILQGSLGQARLLIENSAGQQGKIASQLEEISFILKAINSSRLGWCLDTCHAWSAGYTAGEASGNTLVENDIVKQAKSLKILDKLMVLHVNDSRDGFGSGRDRHENLGEGLMGKKVLSEYVNHPDLKHLPLIIEVPGFDGQGPDKKNLDILKSLTK